jgi:hypothetical protein
VGKNWEWGEFLLSGGFVTTGGGREPAEARRQSSPCSQYVADRVVVETMV